MAKLENALNLVEYKQFTSDEKEYDIPVGNSRFVDDLWDFNGIENAPHKKGAKLQIKFHQWDTRPALKETVKHYIVSVLLKSKFETAKRMMDGITKFLVFVEEARPEITSFSEVDRSCLREYYIWLLQVKSGRKKDQLLSGQSIKKAAQAIHDLLTVGSVKGWDVPEVSSFVSGVYHELIINNSRIKKETSLSENHVKTETVDGEIADKLFRCLEQENELILCKSSILISSQTGLRINEFITLEEGCLVEGIDGEMKLRFLDRKIRKHTTYREVPANEIVVKAVMELEKHTRPLRTHSGLKYLFLRDTSNGITIPEMSNWTRDELKPFIRKWDLRDGVGNPLHLTAHFFRHFFATYAIKQGVRIETVKEMLGHASIRMTEHYAIPIQEDVTRRFGEIFSENATIAGKQALQIKERLVSNNPFKGKTATQVDSLRKAMRIQVLSHGMCTHHPMRNEPCAGDGVCMGCANYLTTSEFIPIHVARLDRVNAELALFGDGPYADKLRTQQVYLRGILAALTEGNGYRGEVDNYEAK